MSHHEPSSPSDPERRSLRGTIVAVALMGAFFVACWLGIYTLLLDRR